MQRNRRLRIPGRGLLRLRWELARNPDPVPHLRENSGQQLAEQPCHPSGNPSVYSLLYTHPPDAFQRLAVAQPAARVFRTTVSPYVRKTRPANAT